MDEEELREKAELPDGVVGRHGRLRAFEAGDADADVRLLDHRDVVGTVANGERHGVLALLDELDRERLLARRDAAAHDGVALRRQVEEHGLERVVERVAQRLAVDDDGEPARLGRPRDLLAAVRVERREAGPSAVDLVERRLDLGAGAFFRLGRQDELRVRRKGRGGAGGEEESVSRTMVRVDEHVEQGRGTHDVHLVREQVAAKPDLDRRLELVACEERGEDRVSARAQETTLDRAR